MDFILATDEPLLKTIAGYCGNAFALFFFFSPIILIYNLILRKIDRKDIPFILFIANTMNCLLWFIYGWFKDEFAMWFCNGIGLATSFIYMLIVTYFVIEKGVGARLGAVFGVIAINSGIFALFWFVVGDDNKEITGLTAMVFNIIMYAAPGQKLVKLFKIV